MRTVPDPTPPHLGPAVAPRRRLSVSTAGSPDRAEHEAFVREAFRRAHGASVRSFMPTLLGLRDPAGRLACVSGYRAATDGALYLEQYLQAPVEVVLGRRVGQAVGREAIVEVGNLASGGCRAAIRMVTVLPRHLLGLGHQWIVFTATSTVHRLLDSVGAPLVELATADAASVAAAADDWGSYYRHDPRVFAGRLSDGLALGGPGRHGPRDPADA